MTENFDPATYDPNAYDRPSVTVDLVLLTVDDGAVQVLLTRRKEAPFAGSYALPGGFVRMDEGLEDAARRVLSDKAGLNDNTAYLEQLYTFGDPARDPRMRIITVAYYALIPAAQLHAALGQGKGVTLVKLSLADDAGVAATADGTPLCSAFDHGSILTHALKRLRAKASYAPVALSLLPERFTLRALQSVHEAIIGVPVNKPAFRRKMIDSGWIEATGEMETGAAFRPAELYRRARYSE